MHLSTSTASIQVVLALSLALSGTACDGGGGGILVDAGADGALDWCVTSSDCGLDLACVGARCVEPAAAGESCEDDASCERGLECRGATCIAVGGLDEPCRRDATCDTAFACDDTACRATVQVRLCHCIYTSETMSPVLVEMQIGGALIGPSNPDVCSPCATVPRGAALPYEIRRVENGAVLQSGTIALTGEPAEVGVAFSAGTFEIGAVACDREVTRFCGT